MQISQLHLCQFCGSTVSSEPSYNFYDKLTRWLDDHPNFTWNYFVHKAGAAGVGHSSERLGVSCQSTTEQTVDEGQGFGGNHMELDSIPQSPNTEIYAPIRKISSQDFDFHDYKKIVTSSSSGRPTFISPEFTEADFLTDSQSTAFLPQRIDSTAQCADFSKHVNLREGLSGLQERDLINELVLDICNELNLTALCFKIIQNVCLLVGADRGSLFLMENDRNTGKKVLVSKLFDVTPEISLPDGLKRSEEHRITIPLGVGITGHVAETGECANITDAYTDERFTDVVDRETGYKTKCVLCMPIKSNKGEVLAVALMINKRSSSQDNKEYVPKSNQSDHRDDTQVTSGFTERDIRVFKSYVAFCGIGLHNAKLYQKSRLETYRNQVLLELARIIFTEQSDVSGLIYTILSHTISLLQCQRCQLLLVDEPTSPSSEHPEFTDTRSPRVFNLTWNNDRIGLSSSVAGKNIVENSHFPVQSKLVDEVVRTGEAINLFNAYNDPLFDPSLEADLDPLWRTQAMLCMPIKHSDGHVLGVCMLVNRSTRDWRTSDGSPQDVMGLSIPDTLSSTASDWSGSFSNADECLFEAFALFAGLGIANGQMYDRVVRLVARQRITLDVLSYHATASKSDAVKLANSLIPTVRFYQLDQFTFTDIKLSDEATIKAAVRMFAEMNFWKAFKIDHLKFCRWLLSVKKNYRQVTYHNWRHAFNVSQTMFAMIMRGNLQKIFTDTECLALLIACVSHDLDHRGTDNQYQVQTMSPLAELYSTSVLEHHHFNQCMMLLTRKGNDFLAELPPSEYQTAIQLIEENILATDLSRYFVHLPQFMEVLNRRSKDDADAMEPWASDRAQRLLLGCMLMTCCDLAAITKPWPVQKMMCELVSTEFFEQGDLEKDTLHTQPKALMDRDNMNDLPKLQIGFIDNVCMPSYKAIVQVSSGFQPLLDGCTRNRACWVLMSEGKEVPESLFGMEEPDTNSPRSLGSSTATSLGVQMGTINATRARQIVDAKPFQSTPARRISSSTSTTVGGPSDPEVIMNAKSRVN
ncbi:unnamed protein product [Calicophoron daubneyi]|uniref:Phosphodiesterase n=1 Tax=Calicophoron daubneyi TaxID=300641 RepID=A0AAV2TFX7_CALDB